MWQGIKFITNYKSSNTCPTTAANLSLPDDLNHFFALFDKVSSHHLTKLTLQEAPPDTLVLNPHEVGKDSQAHQP